jgi:hypothetical protein
LKDLQKMRILKVSDFPAKPVLMFALFAFLLPSSFSQMRQVISSGFEQESYLDFGSYYLFIRGMDESFPSPGNSWYPLPDEIRFELWDEDTYPEKAYYELLPDPLDSTNRVLLAELRGHNGVKGRAQGSFKFDRGTDYPVNVVHFRFRWLIPADWESLGEMDPHGWTDFFELWTRYGNESDFSTYDGAGTFRMNFTFQESEGKFVWHCKGEDRCYVGTDDREWVRYNRDIPVPFGKWAEFEVLVIKGPDPKADPRSQARLLVKIRTDEGPWQTLFDVTDERTEHSYAPQPGYRSFQPVKNYTQANNIDYLIGKGLRPAFYYDDFGLFVSESEVPDAYRYHEIPGRVEAEDFSGMERVGLRETTDVDGGQEVDSIEASDWLEFGVNAPSAGPYRIDCRVSAGPGGGVFQVFTGDSPACTVSISPGASGWLTLSDTLLLEAGNQELRFVTLSGQWAFNWFGLEQVGIPDVVAYPDRDTLCSGEVTGIVLGSTVEMTHGVQYSYTSKVTSGAVTGNGSGILGPGQQVPDVLTNTGDVFGKVDYTIIPYSLSSSGEPVFPGEPAGAEVWIEPVPAARIVLMKDTLDSGEQSMILWNGLSMTTAGMVLGYSTEAGSGGISGMAEGFVQPRHSINEELINAGTETGWVAYTLTPYALDASGIPTCPGVPASDTVWIRPGGSTLLSPHPGTSPLVRIFPNPAGNRLHLHPGSAYVIHSSTGIQLLSGHGTEIHLDRLGPGIYYLSAGGGTMRFIKN